jgi:dTDP-glucose 4,6-dehydratase
MLARKDLDLLLSGGHTFREFDGSTITLLGGTGFIGQWLIKALDVFASNFSFSTEITIITRNSKKAQEFFANDIGMNLKFIECDLAEMSIELERSDFFINGATPSKKKTGYDNSDAVYASTVNASNSIIQSAIKFKNIPRVLNLSSGIVYGTQGVTVRNQFESSISLKPDSRSGYLNAKLASELIFSEAVNTGLVHSISPRLFAFAGPGIALDEHFAVGNFLSDGLRGKQIAIKGNPETVRSYMYPTDLTIWILSALLNPNNQNVNIGSEMPINMLQLAHLISEMTTKKGVRILNENLEASNYVPSTSYFRGTYGVSEIVTLETGLQLWIESLLNSETF